MMRAKVVPIGLFVVLCAPSLVLAGNEALRCQGAKNQTAGKYGLCRLKAEAKLVTSGNATTYSRFLTKCENRYATRWSALEQRAANAGDPCTTTLDQSVIQNLADTYASEVAAALGGSPFPTCGDNVINVVGEECDGTDLGGRSCVDLGFSGGTLACAGCAFDAYSCTTESGVPASGQTTPYGTGSDGDLQAGNTLSYTDNGDGTVTDNITGLIWEKKDDAGGIHDVDDRYTWSGPSYGGMNVMDGTIATTFLATLNTPPCFAAHCDWRIPNAKELQSILDYEIAYPGPMVDQAFHRPGTCAGCTDVTSPACSCTAADVYWSSTTYRDFPANAWTVSFSVGFVYAGFKNPTYAARAVRGGL